MSTWENCFLGVVPCSLIDKIEKTEEGLAIPREGRILLPGDLAIAEADGYPLIVATSGKTDFILAAHSKTLDVISSVVNMFWDYGIPPKHVVMRFLMYSRRSLVKEFISEAKNQGVVITRMRDPLIEFLVANKIPYWERSYIVLHVQQPEKPILRLPPPS